MSIWDLLWLAGVAALLTTTRFAVRSLRRVPDWRERLERSQETVYQRLWDLSFLSAHHVIAALRGPRRRFHCRRASLSAGLLAAVAAIPVLAIHTLAEPNFARHAFALGIGGLIWATVVEGPGMIGRMRPTATNVDLTPPLASTGMVLIADLCICVLVLGRAIGDEPTRSVCAGAAYVAAADVVSIAIGAAAAAFPWIPQLMPQSQSPLKPPPGDVDAES